MHHDSARVEKTVHQNNMLLVPCLFLVHQDETGS